MAIRHAMAIVLLPGTVTILVPYLIVANDDGIEVGWGLVGIPLIVAGFALWLWTVRLFGRIGKGTLAPWDPTQELVVAGPYRYVRNPMITGVVAVLLGEAALFGSWGLLVWCGVFFALNATWFLVFEEPDLERRFGEPYREYKRNVPRWLPRRTAWR